VYKHQTVAWYVYTAQIQDGQGRQNKMHADPTPCPPPVPVRLGGPHRNFFQKNMKGVLDEQAI